MADNYTSYKDNTQSSNANGSTYNVPSTNIKIVDYENVNVIRQACNRGVKGVILNREVQFGNLLHLT